MSADAFADTAARDRLVRLDETLKDLPPDATVARIQGLSHDDRTLLATACRQAMALAGTELETTLGLLLEEAEGVLRWLETLA